MSIVHATLALRVLAVVLIYSRSNCGVQAAVEITSKGVSRKQGIAAQREREREREPHISLLRKETDPSTVAVAQPAPDFIQYPSLASWPGRVPTHESAPHVQATLDPKTCTQAVIVEPRKMKALLRVALSALAQTEVDLVTFAHGELNDDYVHSLDDANLTLSQAKQMGRLTFIPLHVSDLGGDSLLELPDQGSFLDVADASGAKVHHHNLYSNILKSRAFWDDLACDRVVLMQSDTLFCPGSKARIADFSNWSYIGGRTPESKVPVEVDETGKKTYKRMHMNGGLSLRKRPDALACIAYGNMVKTIKDEDKLFSACPLMAQPPAALADRFAVDNAEIVPKDIPLGVHRPWGTGKYKEATMSYCKGAKELWAEQFVVGANGLAEASDSIATKQGRLSKLQIAAKRKAKLRKRKRKRAHRGKK